MDCSCTFTCTIERALATLSYVRTTEDVHVTKIELSSDLSLIMLCHLTQVRMNSVWRALMGEALVAVPCEETSVPSVCSVSV